VGQDDSIESASGDDDCHPQLKRNVGVLISEQAGFLVLPQAERDSVAARGLKSPGGGGSRGLRFLGWVWFLGVAVATIVSGMAALCCANSSLDDEPLLEYFVTKLGKCDDGDTNSRNCEKHQDPVVHNNPCSSGFDSVQAPSADGSLPDQDGIGSFPHLSPIRVKVVTKVLLPPPPERGTAKVFS
jgi:hypothetical protein